MKERIDHSNYEAWLLDRLEGNLSKQDERALDAFLAANPGLDPGMEALPTLGAIDATLSTSAKNKLKRELPPTGNPTTDGLDDHLVARLEGDHTPEQLEALRVYLIEHPEHQRAERLYALAHLVPEAVAFAAKNELERSLPPLGLPTRFTVDDFLVARLEGDLTLVQEQALSEYLATHAEARVAAVLMAHTRITAPAVAYPDHAGLKKGGRVVPFAPVWAVRFAAAASVAALFGLGIWFFSRSDVQTAPQVAERTVEPVQDTRDTTEVQGVMNAGSSVQDGSSTGPRPDGGTPRNKPEGASTPDPRIVRPLPPSTPQEQPAPMVAQQVPPVITPIEAPVELPVAERPAPSNAAERMAMAASPAVKTASESTTLGGLMARTIRERVLDQEAADSRPLDSDDALAAVDRGLRTVGGEKAGIEVHRKADGAVRAFKLRLGSNLSISASR